MEKYTEMLSRIDRKLDEVHGAFELLYKMHKAFTTKDFFAEYDRLIKYQGELENRKSEVYDEMVRFIKDNC